MDLIGKHQGVISPCHTRIIAIDGEAETAVHHVYDLEIFMEMRGPMGIKILICVVIIISLGIVLLMKQHAAPPLKKDNFLLLLYNIFLFIATLF